MRITVIGVTSNASRREVSSGVSEYTLVRVVNFNRYPSLSSGRPLLIQDTGAGFVCRVGADTEVC